MTTVVTVHSLFEVVNRLLPLVIEEEIKLRVKANHVVADVLVTNDTVMPYSDQYLVAGQGYVYKIGTPLGRLHFVPYHYERDALVDVVKDLTRDGMISIEEEGRLLTMKVEKASFPWGEAIELPYTDRMMHVGDEYVYTLI